MTDESSDFSKYMDMSDDIGIPVFGARILVFINEEGEHAVTWDWEGEHIPAYTAAGALESMKLELFHNHAHQLRHFGEMFDDVGDQ